MVGYVSFLEGISNHISVPGTSHDDQIDSALLALGLKSPGSRTSRQTGREVAEKGDISPQKVSDSYLFQLTSNMLRKGTVTIIFFCCSSVEVLFCASLGAANKHQQDHFNCLRFVSFWVAKTSYSCGLGSTRADTKSRSRTTSISENSTLVESFNAEKRLSNRTWSNK